MQTARKAKAFTLLETLLYIALTSIVLTTMLSFVSLIFTARERQQTVVELDAEGESIMQEIIQTARNAKTINAPLAGNTAITMSLGVVLPAKDPTVYTISGNNITVSEAGGAAVVLNSTRVIASALSFKNLTAAGTKGSVRVQFTLTYTNPDNLPNYSYNRTFYGTATLRAN
jgi:type II secretory pathway pseudopilin PulG